MMWQLLLSSVSASALIQQPPVVADTFSVTVASGVAGSDLSDFPLAINLADMPSAFWDDSSLRDDGANLRVYAADGVTPIPHDLTYFAKGLSHGRLFCKVSLASASDTVVVVKIDSAATAALDPADANGREAVWSDYEIVQTGPSEANRTGKEYAQSWYGEPHTPWTRNFYSSAFYGDPHQGLALSGTEVIAVDTNALYAVSRGDLATLLRSNTDPVGDVNTSVGRTALNHSSAGKVINGELWIPVNEWPLPNPVTEYLAVFNLSDLTLNRVYDVSAQGHHIACIAYDPGTDLIYGMDYTDGSVLVTFDTSGVFQGSINLSETIHQPQGLAVVDGALYVSSENTGNPYYEVAFDGAVSGVAHYRETVGDAEGVDYDPATGELWTLDVQGDLAVYSRGSHSDYRQQHYNRSYWIIPEADLSTVWTIASSVYWSGGLDEQAAWVGLAGGTDYTKRATIIFDDGPDVIGSWNVDDGWFHSTVVPEPYGTYRVGLSHNGTTERKLWVDGFPEATDIGCSAKPEAAGGFVQFVLNSAQTSDSDQSSAYYNHNYLRHEVMSDDWMAAEYANLHGGGFYAITTDAE